MSIPQSFRVQVPKLSFAQRLGISQARPGQHFLDLPAKEVASSVARATVLAGGLIGAIAALPFTIAFALTNDDVQKGTASTFKKVIFGISATLAFLAAGVCAIAFAILLALPAALSALAVKGVRHPFVPFPINKLQQAAPS